MTEPRFPTIADSQHTQRLVGSVDGIPVYIDNACKENEVHLLNSNSFCFVGKFIIGSDKIWGLPEIKNTLKGMIPE